jgi:peptidyl-Lys metalloendopeptidase
MASILKCLGRAVVVGTFMFAGVCVARAQDAPCSKSDQTTAQSTVPGVRAGLDKAIAAIDRGNKDDLTKLKRWLGATSSPEFQRIRATLVKARVFADGISFLCAVNTNVALGDIYARVKPGKPFTVVLASFFFSAPDAGFDSKMGVIVHEFTHFILVGATKDKAYGTDEARTLALANPALAQSNADNYEYFVESVVFGL